MFRAFPFFILSLIAYNALMLTGDIHATLGEEITTFNLISGAVWTFDVSDLFVATGVLLLYLEVFKSTNTGMSSVIDHGLSMAVFVIFLVEFLVVEGCGTSTFFILGLMSLVDVVAGFTVSIAGARRDFTYGGQGQ